MPSTTGSNRFDFLCAHAPPLMFHRGSSCAKAAHLLAWHSLSLRLHAEVLTSQRYIQLGRTPTDEGVRFSFAKGTDR